MVKNLNTLATAGRRQMPAFVQQVREMLDIKDGAGLVFDVVSAVGKTNIDQVITEADIPSLMIMLMSKGQRIVLPVVTDTRVKDWTQQAIDKKAALVKQLKALGFEDVADRLEIPVMSKTNLTSRVREMAARQQRKMGNIGANKADYFVLSVPKDLIPAVNTDTFRGGRLINRQGYDKNPVTKGVLRLATSRLSQYLAVGILDKRVAEMLDGNPGGFQTFKQSFISIITEKVAEALAKIQTGKAA